MILIDTSIWIDYFRGKNIKPVSSLLEKKEVIMHPWIFGELMVGSLGESRNTILFHLGRIPSLPIYSVEELLKFVEKEKLYSQGLSFVDIQLLYVCIIHEHDLWTKDKALQRASSSYKTTYRGGNLEVV